MPDEFELVKRLTKGSPLTAQEGDGNWTQIETAMRDLLLAFATNVDDVTIEIASGQMRIKAGGVGTTQLAALSVNESKIALLAITTALLADLAVTSAKMGAGAVIESKLGDGAVSTRALAALAVTAAKIALGAVGSDQLAAGAVTVPKIGYDTVDVASGDVDLDWTTGVTFKKPMTGSDEVTFINVIDGQSIVVILVNTSGGTVNPSFVCADQTIRWTAAAPAAPNITNNTQCMFAFVRSGDEIFAGYRNGYPVA